MKLSGCFVGGAVTSALRVVWKCFAFLAEVIGKIILYFGLYYPLAYAIFGVVLYFIYGLNPFTLDADGKLFLIGFALSVACAAIQAVRNLIIKPFNKHFRKSRIVEYGKEQRLARNAPEPPKIYESKVNKGVIVYEYENRYDLYEKYGDGLRLVSTEYKKKQRRW